MSIFPITPLVLRVQSLILETFDVPEHAAKECAAELVGLAEGWGGSEAAAQLDWVYPHHERFGRQVAVEIGCQAAEVSAARGRTLQSL